MKRWLLLGLMAAASSARAEQVDVDFYIMGGVLRGRSETTWTAESGFIYKPTKNFGLGFAYVNDGHLLNNHRDGAVAQGWYVHPLSDNFEVQVGTGPYASMNNTTIDGVRINQFKVGLFTSVALKWSVLENGWYLRSQFNNTWVPGSFNSNAVLVGVGRDFISLGQPDTSSTFLHGDFSIWGGPSRTTQLGDQRTAGAYQLEVQYLREDYEHRHWLAPAGYSVGFLSEGDTNLAHRSGVPIQFWYIGDTHSSSNTPGFFFSGGVGPYLAFDADREQKARFAGIVSFRVAYRFPTASKRHCIEAGFMYSRVVSFYNRDQDIFMLGLAARL
jgi:hypothetical protein